MQLESPALQRFLAVASAFLLFMGVVGAFAVDDEGDTLDADGDFAGETAFPSTTAPGDLAEVTQSTVADPDAGDGDAPVATTAPGPAAPGGTAAPATVTPGAVKAPAPGTYRYNRVSTADGKKDEKQTDVKVEAAGNEGSTSRVRVIVQEEGFTITHTLAWAPSEVRTEVSRFESSFGTFDCDWNPDSVEYPLPLATGKTWKIDSSCTVTANGQQITVRRTGDFKIVGARSVDVGGTRVSAWVVESSQNVQFGPRAQRTEEVVHFAPEHGLVVYEKSTVKTSEGERSEEIRLQSLKSR